MDRKDGQENSNLKKGITKDSFNNTIEDIREEYRRKV